MAKQQEVPIGELVGEILNGKLKLPEMQRRYVWTGIKVRNLLDSLYRDYPSGSILVWETDSTAPSRSLDMDQPTSPYTTKFLLLDGQQRLTSLSALISGKPVIVKDSKRPIELMFNLEHPDSLSDIDLSSDEEDDLTGSAVDDDGDEDSEESDEADIQERLAKSTFVVYSKSLAQDKNWIRVTDIFQKGDNQLLKPLGINSDDPRWDKYSGRIQKVRNIKNYLYSMQILGRDYDYQEVTEIFVRVNSSGVKLRSSDLALAQITAKWHGSLALFEEYSKAASDYGFNLDVGVLVRALIVFSTGQSRFKTVGAQPLENLQKGWKEAQKGLDFALDFLKRNTLIENLSFLSSPLCLIPIAIIGVRHDDRFKKEEERALIRWLYLAHSFGHYSRGSSETLLDADISVLLKKDGTTTDLISVLERQFGRLKFDDGDIVGKGQRSPLFSMAYLAVKNNGGKDWHNGLAISQTNKAKSNKIEFHHIFPRKLLQAAKYEKSEINEIANMAFIVARTNKRISAKEPAEYLEEIIASRGEEALTSQFVPLDRDLWKIENYREFLETRRQLLIQEINRFLA